jgi:ADP-ribose pyrophosphatase
LFKRSFVRIYMKPKERVISSTIEYKAHSFKVRRDTVETAVGAEKVFSIVEHPGAVVVVPQLADGSFLVLRQWRRAVESALLEFPAGTLEVGEDPFECAKRELIEETNHAASEWHPLGDLYPAPGFCSERQFCYLARGLTPAQGQLDEDEIIEVERVTKDEFLRFAATADVVDGKSLAVFLRAMAKGLI